MKSEAGSCPMPVTLRFSFGFKASDIPFSFLPRPLPVLRSKTLSYYIARNERNITHICTKYT